MQDLCSPEETDQMKQDRRKRGIKNRELLATRKAVGKAACGESSLKSKPGHIVQESRDYACSMTLTTHSSLCSTLSTQCQGGSTHIETEPESVSQVVERLHIRHPEEISEMGNCDGG